MLFVRSQPIICKQPAEDPNEAAMNAPAPHHIELNLPPDGPLEHRLYPDTGIHHFKTRLLSRETTDVYFESLAIIYALCPPDDCVLVMGDMTPGVPNLSYINRRMTEYRERLAGAASRIVYLLPDTGLYSVVRTFASLTRLSNTRREFLIGPQYDQATAWLLAEYESFRQHQQRAGD